MVRGITSFILAVATIMCRAVHARKIGHDDMPVWQEPAPANNVQALAVRFKPLLNVAGGCQPYPAVDPEGNTGDGLSLWGTPSQGCSDKSRAQVYSRSSWYKDAYAIMYSWYMPKDSPSPILGHRHDWENILVWLDSDNIAMAKVIAVAASAHGDYFKSYPINPNYLHEGISAKIQYKASWPQNHATALTTSVGAKQPLIQWEQMTPAAQFALETTDFGSAHVPFRSSFQSYLDECYFK